MHLVPMFMWSVHGGPNALVQAYVNFLGGGYQQKLFEHPLIDLRFFKRRLQRTVSSVFENSEPLFFDGVHCEKAEGVGEC